MRHFALTTALKRQVLVFAIGVSILLGQPTPASFTATAQFVSADTYTRYELLAPESHQFKIYYEVTETRPGAKFHFNAIREGSDATDESVVDLATGKLLKFEVVTGAQAAAASGDKVNPQAER